MRYIKILLQAQVDYISFQFFRLINIIYTNKIVIKKIMHGELFF